MLVEAARAKINLYLHVVARRADGYHVLDSLVAFAAIGDVLSGEPAEALTLSVEGPFAEALAGEAHESNSVVRAARSLAAALGRPPAIALSLTKTLPLAAGLGGGSADAAAALRLCARAWSIDAGDPLLAEIARGLGADVPVCLAGRPAYMGGIGDELAPAPRLPRMGVVLVNPGVAPPTARVFAGFGGSPRAANSRRTRCVGREPGLSHGRDVGQRGHLFRSLRRSGGGGPRGFVACGARAPMVDRGLVDPRLRQEARLCG